MRKICVITGTRAEYGLLYWVMRGIDEEPSLQLQLIVTGMHLSPEFGLTVKVIEQDGFHIDYKVEMLLSSDTSVGIAKSMGVGLIGFADAFSMLKPDIVVMLGDRFELLAAASAAMVARIPIGHIHGGELTEGAIDEAIRHSITKMSHLHFTSTEIYRKRVIQLGEQPNRVFNVGATGIDNIKKLPLLKREEFEKEIGFTLGKHNLLITYHPVTLESGSAQKEFASLLDALLTLQDTKFIFTMPNADTEGRSIMPMIKDFVKKYPDRAIYFTSMGQLLYLSAMKHVDAVVGNSSSGILEAPSFKIGTINIGDRQRGRVRAESIIDCDSDYHSVVRAFQTLYSKKFQEKLKNVKNPHGDGGASEKIVSILKSFPLSDVLKKEFYNIEVTL